MPEKISLTTQLKRLVNKRAHSLSIAEFSRIRKAIENVLAEHQKREGLSTEQVLQWLNGMDDADLKNIARL